jgi:hypothetical protein
VNPRALLLLLAAPAVLAGCRDRYPGLSSDEFVAVNVALRDLRGVDPDSLRSAADSARVRAAVLREHGVTEAELQAFVDARRGDTEALAEAWREISNRLERADSTARADSLRADSVARADSAPPADSLAPRDTPAAADTARPAGRAAAPPPPVRPAAPRDTAPPPPGAFPAERPRREARPEAPSPS